MIYLGSVLVREETPLHSVCFGDIYALGGRVRGFECSFFCVHPQNDITRIRMFHLTVAEVRLCPQ